MKNRFVWICAYYDISHDESIENNVNSKWIAWDDYPTKQHI